ncbi:MAG: tetratricopeptide repeat protein [bacterium]|nr:tetratricopeptide repeat protein [bacterium]
MEQLLLFKKPISNSLAGLFLVVVVLALYANALPNTFVWDDEEQIVNNQVIRDFGNLPEILTSSTFYAGGAGLSGGFYRPMVSFSYIVNYQLWGLHPWGFRIFQILFHILNALLVFFILQRFLRDNEVSDGRVISFLVALLFAIHPANVEAVAYIASVGEVLYSFFILLAFWVILRGINYQEGTIQKTHLWWSIALAFLGLLAKENAIVIFPITLLYLFLFLKPKFAALSGAETVEVPLPPWKKFLRDRAPLVKYTLGATAVTALYLFLRSFVANISFLQPHIATIAKANFIARLMTIPYELITYIKIVFFPLTLSIYQHFVVTSVSDIRFWGSIAALAVIGALLVLAIKKQTGPNKKILILGLAWFVVGIAPMLNLIPLDMTVAERWLYFPMIGMFLFLATLTVPWFRKFSPRPRVVLVVCFLLILVALSARTIIRNADWKDGLTLYGHDIEYSQDNANLENNYGTELFRAGNIAEAEKHFRKSVALEDAWFVSHNNLGAVLEREGKLEEAKSEYQKSIAIADYYLAYQNLAGLLLKMGEKEKAEEFLISALERFPRNSDFSFLLAVLLYQKGEIRNAIAVLEQSLESDPQNAQVQNLYRMIMTGQKITFESPN